MNVDVYIIVHAIPAFILLIVLEAVYLLKHDAPVKLDKSLLASWSLGAGFILLSSVTKGVLLITTSIAYEYRVFNLPQNAWWVWVLCFFADDLTFYWFHRWGHEVRFLWASHSVHHSSKTFNLSANFRQSWTSNIIGGNLWIWMAFVGISPASILFMKSINALYQFLLHTEAVRKLPPWFEYVFNTPSHHRVHHGSNDEYLDKNHGGILILWDRIFNTFKAEDVKPVYGLTKDIVSNNPVVITFYEWANLLRDIRKASSFKQAVQHVFKAPGWMVEPANTLKIDVGKNGSDQKSNHDCSKCQSQTLLSALSSISMPERATIDIARIVVTKDALVQS